VGDRLVRDLAAARREPAVHHGVVTQLQIHTSSSAMPGVIAASIPAPQAGVAGARADPLPH